MLTLQIFLIVIGIAVIVVSYFISDRAAEERLKQKAEEIVLGSDSKDILLRQTKEAVGEILENLSDDVAVRAERELEKMSNEKIMAVHEYSETILSEINKNHNEVMFLYSMLDDKDKEIKQTVRAVHDSLKSVKRVEELLENPKYLTISDDVSDTGAVSVSERTSSSPVLFSAKMPVHPLLLNEEREIKKTENNFNIDIMPEEVPEFVAATAAAGSSVLGAKDKKNKIIELHKKGYTNIEIAKTLGVGVGEVKLALGLYRE